MSQRPALTSACSVALEKGMQSERLTAALKEWQRLLEDQKWTAISDYHFLEDQVTIDRPKHEPWVEWYRRKHPVAPQIQDPSNMPLPEPMHVSDFVIPGNPGPSRHTGGHSRISFLDGFGTMVEQDPEKFKQRTERFRTSTLVAPCRDRFVSQARRNSSEATGNITGEGANVETAPASAMPAGNPGADLPTGEEVNEDQSAGGSGSQEQTASSPVTGDIVRDAILVADIPSTQESGNSVIFLEQVSHGIVVTGEEGASRASSDSWATAEEGSQHK